MPDERGAQSYSVKARERAVAGVMKLFRGTRDEPGRTASSLQGHTLGRYRMQELLGTGGMACVYRAYHPELDRHVAIKVLRSDLLHDEAFLGRFRREARAVAALRHPNIVQVFDYDVSDDISFVVMELLEGDTLCTRVHDCRARGQSMPLGEVLGISLDVLDGLAYAHGEGVIHRDIKPSNILLTKQGRAVIADFGIARIVGRSALTVPGSLLGTVNYMAPEQGLEGQSDARSDIYSLGVVLYEMLVQRPPFEAESPWAVLRKHARDPVSSPRQVNPSIPESLEQVVLTALAKSRGERYQVADEMAEALQEVGRQADIDVPQRVAWPPVSEGVQEPSASVGVFSGSARQAIRRDGFAAPATRLSGAKGSALDQRADSLMRLPPWQIVGAVGVPLVVNLFALTMVALIGGGDHLSVAWPMELLLVAGALSLLMSFLEAVWMLAPVTILAGNGLIFLYCTLTGNWQHWIFLWALDLWLIAGTIWLTASLRRHHEDPGRLSRALGRGLGLLLFVLSLVVLLVGVVTVVASAVLR